TDMVSPGSGSILGATPAPHPIPLRLSFESLPPNQRGSIMHPTKNDLPAEKRTALAHLLNDRLADLIDLQLQAQQAHWNVKGPNSIALPELFHGAVEEIEEYVDTVAERAVALGGTAEGTVGAVAKRTKLPAYPLTISAGRDHVEAFSTALATV